MPRTKTGLLTASLSLIAIAAFAAGCGSDPATTGSGAVQEQALLDLGLATDTSKSEIDIERIQSGGPAKDGIPALTEPEFVSPEEARLPNDEVRGILVEFGGERRYYPYNIMVWHEIVNDVVGEEHVAVTF